MKTTVLAVRRAKALLLASFLALLTACGDQGPASAKAPTPPSDVKATPGPGYLTITWRDNSDNETGFEVYRTAAAGLSAQQAGTKVATVGANATSYVDRDIDLERGYRYSVVAVNAQGSSPAAGVTDEAGVPWHVDLMMGTNRRRHTDEWAATASVVYLVFPLEVLDASATSVRIDGPAGWNDGEPLVANYGCPPGTSACYQKTFLFRSYPSIPAVTGDYELTVTIGGEVYTATDHLDASFRLARPTDLEVAGVTPDSVSAKWTNPTDARSALLSLHRGTYEGLIAGYHFTTEVQHTFQGLALEDGAYGVEIAPVNADVVNYPVKIDQFGMSYEYAPFHVGDE